MSPLWVGAAAIHPGVVTGGWSGRNGGGPRSVRAEGLLLCPIARHTYNGGRPGIVPAARSRSDPAWCYQHRRGRLYVEA